jgi:hypothetical protein
MKLFSEKVDSTFTNSSFNVLQVENFSEIFFDVYEIELNKIKYPAEKIGDHEGHPVVSVPVVIGEQECRYPFVLVKGPFNVLFNENNRILGAQSRKIDSTNVNEELEELIEETSAEDEITYDNLIQEESKLKILEQIRDAKQKAAAQINKLKLVAIDEATIDLKVKKQEFDKVLESAKDQLVNEFVYISNNIKNELLDATNSRYEELDDTFSSRIDTLVEELQFDLKSDFKSASKLLDSNIRSLISEIHSAQVIPTINSEISKIAAKVSDKVQKIEEKLDTKLSSKADIALVESINTSVEAIQVANVELNDAINKGVNRALSRVGTVNSKLAETVSVLSEKIDHKINTATEDITEYYTNKIKALEDRTFEINESSRQYFIQLVQESRDNLIQEIRDIKKDAPVEYIVEANNKRTTKSLDSITSELDKKITSKVTDEIARLKQYISMYSSGGGSVAQQFANGGTMNGNLTVAGTISASNYLGLVIPNPDLSQYLPISGGTITGNLVVNNTLSAYSLSADRIFVTQLDALSANITVIDIKQYELSGFNVTGNCTIQGSVSSNSAVYGSNLVYLGGNSTGSTVTIGTNDNYNLNLETNNVTKMTIMSSGEVGIGTTTPNQKLTVVGNISASGTITGTLTNATGLPIITGVSGLGTNVATFLATPTSSNLAAAVTDEVGSGALVFKKEFQSKVATSNLSANGIQTDSVLTVNVSAGGIYQISSWFKLSSNGTAVLQGNLGGTCTLSASKQTFILERAGFNSENVVLGQNPYASYSMYNVAAGGVQGAGFRGTLTPDTSGTLYFAFYASSGTGTVLRLAGSFLQVERLD